MGRDIPLKKQEKTQRSIARIIESAMAEFGTRGYSGGTMEGICRAGLSKGLIYHHFAGKDALYLACLRRCCNCFVAYVIEQGGEADLNRYMAARMRFRESFPQEARILFEALITPPSHLAEDIVRALGAFHALSEQVYHRTLDALVLREGVTREQALSYFRLMQTMLNGYFGSSAFQNVRLGDRVRQHEQTIPQLLDYMLYGIAKGADEP